MQIGTYTLGTGGLVAVLVLVISVVLIVIGRVDITVGALIAALAAARLLP